MSYTSSYDRRDGVQTFEKVWVAVPVFGKTTSGGPEPMTLFSLAYSIQGSASNKELPGLTLA